MNFKDESSFNTDIVGDNGNAIGLAQWNGQRKANLEAFARDNGKSATDFNTQLDFFMKENTSSEAGAWNEVLKAGSAGDAAARFVEFWERPRADHLARRKAAYGGGSADVPAIGNGSADISVPSVELSHWQTNTPRAPEVETAEPGFWQLQKDAYNREQTLPWLAVQNKQIDPDPNWSLDPKRIGPDLEARGIPVSEAETYSHRLSSVSEADYQDNLGRVKDDWDRGVRLSNAGFTGSALSIANNILDPVALGADIMASTVAPEMVVGNRARRLGRVLEGAMAGAAGGASSVAVSAAVNPHTDQSDLLAATVFGFGMGGAVGHLFGRPETTMEALSLAKASRNAAEAHEGITLPGSVGAAKASPAQPFLNEDGLGLLQDKDFEKTFGGRFRVDLSARMQEDANPLVKAAAGLVQDGTGKANGAINAISASEDMTRLFEEKMIYHQQVYTTQLRDFASRAAKGTGKDQIERDFNRKIDAFIRDRASGRTERYDPAVVKAANKQTELYADALELMKNPYMREGIADARPVLNADAVKADKHFAPRFWDSPKLIEARKMFGPDAISNLVGRAMKSANTALDDTLIERTSKAFTNAILDRAHGLDDVTHFNLSQGNLDALLEMLEGHYGLVKEDTDALRWQFAGKSLKGTDKGADGHLKTRLLLDEQMSHTMKNQLTGTMEELKLSDLFSTDARANFTRYMRSTMGRVSLARYRYIDPVTKEVLINGITSDGDWNKYMKLVALKNADLISAGKITKAEAATSVKRMEFAYASILGRPTNTMDATNAGWTLRMIRKFNFARIMNQVGFAQLSEIGMPIASLGWKASLSQAPALRRVLTDDGASILKSGLADDLEAIMGVGADRLLHSSNYNLEDLTHIYDEPTKTWKDVVERGLNKANKFTSEVSGLTQANVMLERWTAAAIIQRFSDMAHGGKAFSAKRLADLGLTKDMNDRVMAMFKTDGNFEHETGFITGRKVTRAHFDKWADKEAREAFIQAAHRLSRQVIQKNDIGNMAMWMSHPLAKIFMQFRTFMVGAYAKQTLKALNMRDPMAFHQLMMTSGLATASYVAQMKLQAMGRADKDKFLEERLSAKNLMAAGFARAGMSSIIPMLVDSGLYASGNNALFSYTRTTGQASNMVFGNPTFGGFDDFTQATRGVAGLFREGDWSQDEARTLTRILPFGNALPITMGLNAAISDLPKHPPRQ
ncbi:hypothetical protein CK228_13610 [Mesorhizobium sp. WSM4312]|nr:hypothetical protein CK228_13610 [Mesorhizobium sp. WSM4312]